MEANALPHDLRIPILTKNGSREFWGDMERRAAAQEREERRDAAPDRQEGDDQHSWNSGHQQPG